MKAELLTCKECNLQTMIASYVVTNHIFPFKSNFQIIKNHSKDLLVNNIAPALSPPFGHLASLSLSAQMKPYSIC